MLSVENKTYYIYNINLIFVPTPFQKVKVHTFVTFMNDSYFVITVSNLINLCEIISINMYVI